MLSTRKNKKIQVITKLFAELQKRLEDFSVRDTSSIVNANESLIRLGQASRNWQAVARNSEDVF